MRLPGNASPVKGSVGIVEQPGTFEALKSPAFYVGAIGSRKNNDARRERLAAFDLSQEEIDRLHGPVGLKIGSKTPPEIAIAILAEMTALRNGVTVAEFIEPEKATVAGCSAS